MKRSIKLVVCMLLVATIALPSVFATGLGTSSSIVKVGTVDNTDVVYDVDIEWGSLVYNLVLVENENNIPSTYYSWEPEEEGVSDTIKIYNRSNAMVHADITFASTMPDVSGSFSGSTFNTVLAILTEKPDDWDTGYYQSRNGETYEFTKVAEGTEFEPNKYWGFAGAGGEDESGDIPGVSTDILVDGRESITLPAYWGQLSLYGGDVSNVRPGATIGTLTVTIS